jgi:hypothetical protein
MFRQDPASKLAQAEGAARQGGERRRRSAAGRARLRQELPGQCAIPDVFIFSPLLAETAKRHMKGILEHVVQKYRPILAQEAKRYLKSMEQVT